MTTSDNTKNIDIQSILYDMSNTFLPFFKVHEDGQIERYILTSKVKAGMDRVTGIHTKDVVISTNPDISGRIFLPKLDEGESPNRKKLPLLIHYHGGGFCTGSAFGPIIKNFLSNLVSMAYIVAFSIDYRLAPEYPLPIAYEDSWAAFQWIAAQADENESASDPWFNKYVDFNRVFLCGESSGANLAHDVAIRASVEPLPNLNLAGLLSIHPYFAAKQPERLIKYLYPTSSGSVDDPRLNPGVDPRLYKLACDKVLVCVAEKDKYKERGLAYIKHLEKTWKGKVEVMETLGEGHCFHVLDATSPNIDSFMSRIASFLKED
ncbi:2-hydroxyisoflavanone dehydratase-like [Amaranthus tricolor]|uniref:2-hydroxyisoflavanone dehydratase-like n=1 Tax=Amaranthus tricolor TaxID=29722 RepID=UPI0025839730|nr:2-hydroxyisoflavanone dehydratase-like [Amaranthus tricolor]